VNTSTFKENAAIIGGAIVINQSKANLETLLFESNSGSHKGGSLFLENSIVEI
jgi:predicted outer membrane repeat protein